MAWMVAGAGALAVEPLARWAVQRRADDVGRSLRALTWPIRAWVVISVVAIVGANGWWPLGSEASWLTAAARVGSILVFSWLVSRSLGVVQGVFFRRLRIDVDNNRRARSRRTQLALVRRIVTVFVWVTAVVVAALTFESVRRLGPAVVAYAGIIGVLVGVALRAPLENLMSGLMVATVEPVRIDDIVVVNDELGHVEEIGLSQVVVRLWDRRRLILPTSHFVSGTFENWTRLSTDLVGIVTVAADHEIDVDAMRSELRTIVAATRLWDGTTCVLEVTDLSERAVELRALVSARTASELWDLRCLVREQLLGCLRRQGSLPRARTELLTAPHRVGDAATTPMKRTTWDPGEPR